MLQVIHRYRRSIFGFFFLLILGSTFAFSGVGVDALHLGGSGRNYAIKINDREISYGEFAQQQRNSQAQPSQMVDSIVLGTLLEQDAQNMGLAAGDDQVRDAIQLDLFQGNFDSAQYAAYLRQMGMTSRGFEDLLRRDALRSQYVRLLTDSSAASRLEARARYQFQETEYAVVYGEFSPQSFRDKVPAPSEEEILNWYEENASEFELPPRAAYDYALIEPGQFASRVELQLEDLEFYYTEHERDFAVPERAKVRAIHVLYPKDGGTEGMVETRERANEALEKARAGDDFAALAAEYSNDPLAGMSGGDLGWIERGEREAEFDSAVFALKGPGVAELIEAENGFWIAKVEEYQPRTIRDFNEVKDEIESKMRAEEAPAYALAHAAELLDKWSQSGTTLAEFAAAEGLTAASTARLLTASEDPETRASGLTKKIIEEGAGDERRVVDFGELIALVEMRDLRESEIAPLEEVRSQVVNKITSERAVELARQAAERAHAKLSEEPDADFKSVLSSEGATVQTAEGLSRSKLPGGVFSVPELRDAVFSRYEAGGPPSEIIRSGGKLYIVQVTAVKPPAPDAGNERLDLFERVESARLGAALVESRGLQLKAASKIDVAPELLAAGDDYEEYDEEL